jgi:excisionase family DNA binding protein
MSTTLPTDATVSVQEAARYLGISRRVAYEAVARGEIPAVRIGRKILVPRERLTALLDAPRGVTAERPHPRDPLPPEEPRP